MNKINMKETKLYKITFEDNFKCKSEKDCYEKLLDYLSECIVNKDVMAFDFKEIKDMKLKKQQKTTKRQA